MARMFNNWQTMPIIVIMKNNTIAIAKQWQNMVQPKNNTIAIAKQWQI